MSAALLENFDLLAASVGGVARLRELILSLAVRGRLVPQDPNDEPASELLKRIRAEKDRLIKEGKIKREKPLPPVSTEEEPCALPTGWAWVRFSDVILSSDAGWSPSCDSSPRAGDNWGVLKVSAVTWGEFRPSENKALPGHLDPRPECEVQAGDFLLSRANTEELVARSVVAWSPPARLMLSDKLIRLKLSKFVNKALLCLINNSTDSRRHYIAHASGTSSSMKNVSREVVLSLPVPIPPEEEQSRIVAKVDELMALCDRLEAEQGHAARVQGHWVDAALDQLAESADANEFRRHWLHLAAHFDTLFTTPESIDRLDATLLQLAVRGKLVPQDPNDEPASELLKQIRTEKDRLIKEGKIKRDKALPPVSGDDRLYALPNGWEWVRKAEAFEFLNGYAFKSEWFQTTGVPLLRNVNISHGSVDWSQKACIAEERLGEFQRFELQAGDLVLSLDRPLISTGLKYAVIQEADLPCLLLQRVARISSVGKSVEMSFLELWLKSDLFTSSIDPGRSNGVPHISTKQVEALFFPLPPLAEQSRIVAQLEKLQALTASFKVRLTAAQTKQAHLSEALIAEVV